MRSIVERMARMSKSIQVTAYQAGRMIFRIDDGATSIQTFYNGLVPRFDDHLDPEADKENDVTVMLDIKKLSLVLNQSSHIPYSEAILCEYARKV